MRLPILISKQVTDKQIDALRRAESETEHLEFKEAKNQFDFNDLLAYCVALANEGGGVLLLGVANKPPRPVVGTNAYLNVVKITEDLFNKLHFRVDVEAVQHPDGRVLVFHIPSRPIGHPYHIDGSYLMRSGESLVPMSQDQLKKIFYEQSAVFGGAVAGYDDVLASQILSRLNDASPNKLSLPEVKAGLPDFAIRTDAEWLLAMEALNRAGLIDGIFHHLGINKTLRGAKNLQITSAGKEQVRQTNSELADYLAGESPDLDALTQLPNRRRFARDLASFSARANQARPLTLIQLDIDRFKDVNDTHGHGGGDKVLAEIALLFRTLLEKRGGCYRTGGDEFAVLLPNHSLAEAEALAKRICTLVSESRFEGKTDHIKITATASIASLPETALDSEQMIKDADLTLYKAKHDGGNRAYVCLKR